MFRFAHLTDPHVGPLPRPRLRSLLNKRLTGYVNWRRGRRDAHDMELLAALVADMRAQNLDHIACTGDICNIGLPSEWATSRVFLEGLGLPEDVSFVPGNHDAYVPGSLEGLLAEIDPWARGDNPGPARFPYLRRRGPVAFVGLSTAVPTAPFVASGKLGLRQRVAAEAVLAALAQERCIRVVLIHHPPHVGGALAGRNLTDADKFEEIIDRVGAELIVHGHNHTGTVAQLAGPAGSIVPVVGAPSASARGGALTHKAGYHVFTIEGEPGAYRIEARLRGLTPQGTIADMGSVAIAPGRVHARRAALRA